MASACVSANEQLQLNTLRVEIGDDGVALVTIDTPDRPVNLFTPEFVSDLSRAVDRILGDASIKGAVLTSGKRGFIAGADLKDLAGAFDRGITQIEAAGRFRVEKELLRRIETGGKPFAAAINGVALGGGLELCLACHYRVLADDPKALVGLPEVTVGLLPAGGGTQRLPRLVGIERALPLLLEGKPVRPGEALELGVVNAVVAPGQVVENARHWILDHPDASQPWDTKDFAVPGGAGPLAAHAQRSFTLGMARISATTQGNYPAPVAILSAVYEGTQLPLDLGLKVEAKYFGQLLANPVARNLMRTLFINKGIADKLGRRPSGIPKTHVSALGVIGAGMMGAGIAQVCAAAGIKVVVLDTEQDLAEKGKRHAADVARKSVQRGQRTQDWADGLLARILPTTDYAMLGMCDLVIEAVFEDRGVKADVTKKAAGAMPATAFFASNTSTLPITGLARNFARPEDFIGIHFFSPVERMPLVEIIVGQRTSSSTLARALDLVGDLRKTPIVVNDSPGFYTSRIFCTYIDEGMAMLEEGVSPSLIENAARMAGMATGPLAVTDEVSLDLQKKVIDQALADKLPERMMRSHARKTIMKLNELGRLGRKSGGGFYEFPAKGRKRLWAGLADLYPVKAEQPPLSEVMNRLMYIQALEAARCFEEGVITDAMDADIGSVLGLGFPSWTGGTLSFIETVGFKPFLDECRRLAERHGNRFEPSPWLVDRAMRGASFHASGPGSMPVGRER